MVSYDYDGWCTDRDDWWGQFTFSRLEKARLARLRQAYREGRRGELTYEMNRLLFARWLREHGRISDGSTSPLPVAGEA